jgi:hypothetical protein
MSPVYVVRRVPNGWTSGTTAWPVRAPCACDALAAMQVMMQRFWSDLRILLQSGSNAGIEAWAAPCYISRAHWII